MHELSIAKSLIELACVEAEKVGKTVEAVHIRVGAMSGVVPETLVIAYEFASQSTILEGSRLIIEAVPVSIFCQPCGKIQVLPGIQSFACPACGVTSCDLRAGRELDITALEVVDSVAFAE